MIFVDTYFWIAFTNSRDSGHEAAMDFAFSGVAGGIVTTEEVLTEYLNYFAGKGRELRKKATTNVQIMVDSGLVEVIPQSSESFRSGLALYQARMDKGYSLTDCISMEAMRRQGIAEILTNDRHFAQEGFVAVFR